MLKHGEERTMHPLVLIFWVLAIAGIPVRAPAADAIVPADAKLEKLFDGGCTLTEGVAVAPDGRVYFSDITFTFICRDEEGFREAGHIWRFDPDTGATTIYRSPSGMSNGIKFVLLSHNTKMGAAKGAVLTAEVLVHRGLISSS